MRLSRKLPALILAASLLAPAAVVRAADTDVGEVAPFTRDQFLASLTKELTAHFNLDGELQLELVRTWTPPARVSGNWTLEILDFPSMPSSSMLVRCRALADKQAAGEFSVIVRANLWRDAWVAKQALVAGTAFDPAQLETRRVDLFRERDVVPSVVGDHSFIFSRSVSAGRLLTWHDIGRRPLVKKGQVVEVSAIEGPLTITLKALAMENGAQGETVTMRNPESRKEFSALVIDENHVQVSF